MKLMKCFPMLISGLPMTASGMVVPTAFPLRVLKILALAALVIFSMPFLAGQQLLLAEHSGVVMTCTPG